MTHRGPFQPLPFCDSVKAKRKTSINVLQGSILGRVQCNILINDLDDGTEFADDTKLTGLGDTPAGRAVIHRDLDRLEKQSDRNFMKLSKRKCKVRHLTRKNPRHMGYMMAAEGWEAVFQKICFGGLGGHHAECEPAVWQCRKGG